jgi:hypothetical protein
MRHNLRLIFWGKWQILTPWAGKLLSLLAKNQTVVIWSRSFWSFSTWERGYLLTIYINIYIYIIVAVLTASVFDFDQMTNDQMTACL